MQYFNTILSTCRRPSVFITVIALIIIASSFTLYFVFGSDTVHFQAAIVSNGVPCAEIGRSMLEKHGSVADAAIATLLCEGIATPQALGIGGGFAATIFTKSSGKVETLIAREVAPLAATEDMFENRSVQGGLAVALPSEVKGYAALHRKYGRLNWATLIKPAIKLCVEGTVVTSHLAKMIQMYESSLVESPSMKEIFVNPKTGKVYRQGDKIKRPKLAKTLEVIAKEGEKAIYNGGQIGKKLVEDITELGGILTIEDFKQYRVRWGSPTITKFDQFTVNSIGLPGSGPVLSLILNMMQKRMSHDGVITWQRIIESFKHAYGLRTHLGDVNFLPEVKKLAANMSKQLFADDIFLKVRDDKTFTDYGYYGANASMPDDSGTANIAVFGRNGDAIVVTSTINSVFGNKHRSRQTGIILNNQMADFSIPGKPSSQGLHPSPSNYVRPKKMPMSSMVPTIILDKNNNPRLLIGAAGGSKITTTVSQVIFRHLIFSEPLDRAIDALRIHHQLIPMRVQYEPGFDQTILDALVKRGHEISEYLLTFSAVTAISVSDSKRTEAAFDRRRPGSIAFY